jgi:hypothetical protein
MAWIEERTRADGGVSACVVWREDGHRGSPRQRETFSAGSDAQNRARAEGFKQMVDAAGQHWPAGWERHDDAGISSTLSLYYCHGDEAVGEG